MKGKTLGLVAGASLLASLHAGVAAGAPENIALGKPYTFSVPLP